MSADFGRKTALLAAVCLSLVLTGCGRKERETVQEAVPLPGADAAATPADAAAPFRWAEQSEHARVSLTLPAEVRGQPDLHARLYGEGVRDLKAFAEGAMGDRAEMEGPPPPPYERTIAWTATAETSKLLSLKRREFEFAGGAHPNTVLGAVLWDKALKRQIGSAALFRADTDFARLDAALCESVRAARRQRVADGYDGSETCPRLRDSAFVLAPSTVAGKAGGLTFLFSPFDLKTSTAEGPYEVTLPREAFAAALATAYADEFAGGPAG